MHLSATLFHALTPNPSPPMKMATLEFQIGGEGLYRSQVYEAWLHSFLLTG